ncbi:MAG: ribulose-phosphate 3-epimerase [Acidimicrobiales bacterium]
MSAGRDPGAVGAIKIAPSLLSADFGALGAAVEGVAGAADWLHLDVMDAHFVANLTIGPPVVASLRRHSSMFFDCHLMMEDPGSYLEDFSKAGADSLTVHVEVGDTAELLLEIRRLGMRAGLAASPQTGFESMEEYLGRLDVVLCMTVHPGFGGQDFMAEMMDKVRSARAAIDSRGLAVDLEVDGGIDEVTATLAARAGANVLVAGSAVFGHERPRSSIEAIRAAAMAAHGG